MSAQSQTFSVSPVKGFAAGMLLLAGVLLAAAPWQLKWVAAAFHKQPGFWPVVSLAGIAVFAAAMLAWREDSAGDTAEDSSAGASPSPNLQTWLRPAEYALYFLLYVYAVPRLGYLPATLIGISLLTRRLGYRGARFYAYACAVGLAIVLLFKTVLQVKIPGGAIYALLPDAARNFFVLYF